MKKIFLVCGFLMSLNYVLAQSLYDVNNITLIEIEFEETNWDEIMDDYYENDMDERLVGKCTINGEFYDSVGVAFKGNSTYSPDNLKNPLNISLDHILDQSFQGYTTFKLSNGAKDPSFVREVLSYEIARDYMDVPLSNYAKVMINGNYYGLFASSESINGDYHERRLFCDDDNVRFKCNPVSIMAGGSSLEYLGTDSTNYYDFYELKSDFGWAELIDFTFELQSDIGSIENHLDVDRAIWMLAFNSVLVNLDSYTGPFQQNYYLILDQSDRFLPITWDLNQSLGSFSMIETGGGPPGPTDLEDLTDMDIFLRLGDTEFPLINQLLSVPRYRRMYVAHVKTMVEEHFADGSYYDRAEEIQDIIETEVGAEPNGFYTVTQFNNNLDESITGGGPGGGIVGISELMDARVDYLENLDEFGHTAPVISSIESSPANPIAFNSVTITAAITDANYAYLGYRNDIEDPFDKVEMFDDGMHGDGAAGDNIYGGSITLEARDVQFYIYADNDLAGKFSPERAEHEFYDLIIGSDVVINELMPLNNTIADQDGEFDDWIELYNRTASSIDLSGYYLSDSPTGEPLMWEIPEGTTIEANDYLVIWLDDDTAQEGLHATFKLSSSGETVSFSDPDGFEISRVEYPEMYSGTTYGRYPNGDGPFMRMFPTLGAENSFTALDIGEVNLNSNAPVVYPNPATDQVTFSFDSDSEIIQVYDISGKLQLEKTIHAGETLDISQWNDGLYLIVFQEIGISKKLIKH